MVRTTHFELYLVEEEEIRVKPNAPMTLMK